MKYIVGNKGYQQGYCYSGWIPGCTVHCVSVCGFDCKSVCLEKE